MSRFYSSFTLLLVAIALTLPGLGDREFSTRGEPREALVAQAMLNSGNWILPEGYGGVVPSKPPVTHWLMALFSIPGGEVTELTARLPCVVASVFFALCFFRFLSRETDSETAWWSVVICVSSLEWLRSAASCRVDLILATTLFGALLLLLRWFRSGSSGLPVFAILLLALATLTKGPVSIVLPAAIFGIFMLAERKPFGAAVWSGIKAFLPALLLALTWYGAAYLTKGDLFLDKVRYENLDRFMGTMEDEPHRHSAVYLLGTTLLGFLPWSLPILISLILKSGRVKELGRTVSHWWKESRDFERLFLIIILLTTLFYSVPHSKRSVYLLPIYPALSFFVAQAMLKFTRTEIQITRAVSAAFGAVTLGMFLLFICVSFGILNGSEGHLGSFGKSIAFAHTALAVRSFSDYFRAILTVLCLAGATIVLLVPAFNRKMEINAQKAVTTLFVGLFFLVTIWNEGVGVPFQRALSPKLFASEISKELPSDAKLWSFQNELYGLSFYLNRSIYRLGSDAKPGDIVFAYERDLQELSKILAFESVRVSSGSIVKPNERVAMVRVGG